MMDEKTEIEREKRYLELILNAYNSEPKLMTREGAQEYIDSILDRINELNKKLEELNKNNPSE